MVVVIVVRLAGELSSRDNEPAASAAAGRFQLRPSALDRYASSLFKGDVLMNFLFYVSSERCACYTGCFCF